MTNAFDLELIKVTVILNNEARVGFESSARLYSGEGEWERTGVCCYSILSLAGARELQWKSNSE